MAQQVYLTYTENNKMVADTISNHTFVNSKIKIQEDAISADDLVRMAKMCPTEFFYVITSESDIYFPKFNFSFKPPVWDSKYVHIWGNSNTLRLYNKELVLRNPGNFSDDKIIAGEVELKIIQEVIYKEIPPDIVFLSFDEEDAVANYKKLLVRFPRAMHIHGVKGIFAAHMAAAKKVSTDVFYVVDADADVLSDFSFDYKPPVYDRNSVYVWQSLNPVNDLVYGYGGIKLFNTHMLLGYVGSSIDFTTSVSENFKLMPEISNITKFNTDPFSAWRSGFRECAKLSSKIIINQDNTESEKRLDAWCSKGFDRDFGEFVINGAQAGAAYGKAHMNQPELLGLINDFEWLKSQFDLAMQT
jgi:hypothetical protein